MLSESFFSTVATTVFEYLLQESDLARQVRDKLGLNPARLAFQSALVRAYVAFERQYPQWTAALFDQTLLTRQDVAGELAQLLTRHRQPDAAAIADAWADSFPSGAERTAERTAVVSDFLTQLEDALKDEEALQSLFDHRALERMASDTRSILKLLNRLNAALSAAGIQVRGSVWGSILVTGDNNIIGGIRRLPTDYAGRIENFIFEYTGTSEKPVPFGGREEALDLLDAWLRNETPYLLLTAPAGRGKSALLVRWLATLQARERAHVLFVPISIRFDTNLETVVFAALAARLAHLFGEEVPGEADTPAEVWRGIVDGYLRRQPPEDKPLLVVLDGLDEAAGWDIRAGLFPLQPPQGLKVLLSARLTADRPTSEDWLRSLSWENKPALAETMTLAPLTRAGVADVLARMGVPLDQLAGRVDIVAELHRLSEGDPLLVRLYVEDLWARGEQAVRLQPEDLQRIEPGYAAYFNRWWEDQEHLWGADYPLEKENVAQVFDALACAFGPLQRDDLQRLTKISSHRLQAALRPIARFVIARGAGYVFAHPKLADHFFGQLTQDEQDEWNERFLAWGREVLEVLQTGDLPPQKAPPYLVQYFTAHLARAQATLEEYLPLVQHPQWAQAWHALEGSYAGYLNEVRRIGDLAVAEDAQAAAAEREAPRLGLEIRCALVQASVHSLAAHLSPALLVALVEKGLWTPAQALATARQMPDKAQRAEALSALASHLPPEMREQVLAEALAAARQIGDEYDRALALRGLAPHLPPDLQAQALAATCQIEDEYDRAEALRGLAPHLPPDLLSEALAAARQIENERWRARALSGLAPHLPSALREKVLVEALAAARQIGDADDRARALSGLAPHLPPGLQAQVLSETLAAARELPEKGRLFGSPKVEALTTLAPHLPPELREQALSEALDAARQIKRESARAYVLRGLAPHLPPALREQVLTEALAVARQIGDEDDCAYALSGLAPHLPPELLAEALDAARQIEDGRYRVYALSGLGPHLPPDLLSEAWAVARQIEDEFARASALRGLAPHLPPDLREQALAEALAAARQIEDESDRADVLSDLAPHLPPELLAEALAAARQIEDESDRAEALTALAPHLPPALREQALAEALAIARELPEKGWLLGSPKADTLRALAPHLPPHLLSEALAAARQIGDESDRAEVLTALAPYLPPELLAEALAAARQIEDESDRADALSALAPHLPPDLLAEALAAARQIGYADDRALALSSLAPHLAEAERAFLYPLWQATLPVLTSRTRKDLLADLHALTPVIHKLGGSEVIVETFRAIRDVGQWWP